MKIEFNENFNGKSVRIEPYEVSLFFKEAPNGDLYLKHKKLGDYFVTNFFILKEGKLIKETQEIKNSDSLKVSNSQRDGKLKKLAQTEFYMDIERDLINAGGFITQHFNEIFPHEENGLIGRNKKETQLMKIAEKVELNAPVIIDKLTGDLHIYNQEKGLYERHDEIKFSSFLTKLFGKRFFKEEVKKIMGVFNNVKEESENYIAFKNCHLNVNRMETKRSSPVEFVKFQVPFNWNPDAYSEFFEQKLKEILGDGEKYKLFFQMVGYCFTKGNPYNYIFLLIGGGANGKTTLLDLLNVLFHESASAVSLHQFKSDFGLQPLLGKRINILPDLPLTVIEDTGIIKAITGGDDITINRKHKDPITTKLDCKIIGSGNILPPINDDTYAFWRRIVHIELTNTFKGENKDPFLTGKLINDQAGMEWLIYNAVQEYKKVAKEGWAMDDSAEKHRKLTLKEHNPCLYAVEEIFDKTNDENDFIAREKVRGAISNFLRLKGLTISDNLNDYYGAIRHFGGIDKEKRILGIKERGFAGIKLKQKFRNEIENQEIRAVMGESK